MINDLGGQILEVAPGEPRAVDPGNDIAERLVDDVGHAMRTKLSRGLVDELHIEVDVRA